MAVSSPKAVLVFGATGTIGKYITDALVNDRSSFNRVAIFTSNHTVETKAAYIDLLKSKGAEIIVGDVSNESNVKQAYTGFDTVISALGRGALHQQIDLIRLAEETPNIKYFFPSEYGTDVEFGAESANEKPHQQKLKVRAYFRDNAKRLKHVYLVTGPYADMYIGKGFGDPRYGSFDIAAKKAVLLGSGDDKVALTTMTDVGKLLVAALEHSDGITNRALIVNSFTTTPNEILGEFEKQTGAKWEVSYTPLDELKKLEQEAYSQENPVATGITLRRIWTEGGTLYDKPRDNEAIGFISAESLQDVVAKVIKEQS